MRTQPGAAAGKPPKLPGGVGPVTMKLVDVVRQNAILRRMQDVWNAASLPDRQAMLKQHVALRRMKPAARLSRFVELGVEYGTLRGEADVRHASEDWLGDYFEGSVIDVLIEGLVVGMKQSIKSGLPVAIYWVAGSDSQLKMAVARGPAQVTLMLVTPPRPAKETPVRELRTKEPIWIVRTGKRGVDVAQVVQTALVDVCD